MPKFDSEDRETYRVVFKSLLGYSVFIFCAYLLSKVAFMPKETLNEHTGTIVGFITGSAFALILGFYFGSSDKKERKRFEDGFEEEECVTPEVSLKKEIER